MAHKAIFLDRDGVLIEDRDLLADVRDMRILEEVPGTLRTLKAAGFHLVVITNQAVVARGLLAEADLQVIHGTLDRRLQEAGAPPLDAIYYCPHHPEATLAKYRVVCDCRKPRPGALLRAAREHDLDLRASFFVGDRVTDILAGAAAGCRTVLIQGPKHLEPPIVTVDPIDTNHRPDHICSDLHAAAEWILGLQPGS